MKITIITVIVLILTSCTNPSKEKQKNQSELTPELKSNIENNATEVPLDTLRDPNHYYYLADLDPKEVGKMILDDKIPLYDNYCVFRVMDSLMARTFDDRKFYFNVFLKIVDDADGALAEVVGIPAMKYFESYTSEFLDFSSKVSDEVLKRWASFIGIEIFLSSNNPIATGKDFVSEISNNCHNLSTQDQTRLDGFNNDIISTILVNIKNNK